MSEANIRKPPVNLSDYNGIRTQNLLLRKQTFNNKLSVNEISSCGFESCCSHLNFKYRVCFERGVP